MKLRRLYGAGPAHLLAAVASFAVAAWALSRVLGLLSDPVRFLAWLAGAIVAHDLVLFPVYTALGLVTARVVAGPALNHLRVPILLCALSLLVWFPLILHRNPAGYMRASGMSADVYLERWLLLSAALLVGSAVILALRRRGLRQ